MASIDTFRSRATLDVGGRSYEIFRLDAVPGLERLPYSLKILAENLLRTEDGADVTAEHVRALASWDPGAEPSTEIQFTPARVIMQDFTGVPCVVDLATMREAVVDLGGDPERVNPLAPAEMVIDHSVQIDSSACPPPWNGTRSWSTGATPSATSSALGAGGLLQLPGGAAGHRHRPPGQYRVPGPHRLHP